MFVVVKNDIYKLMRGMKKFGMLFLCIALAISISCGQAGKKQAADQSQPEAQAQEGPRMQDPQRGPGGRGQFNPEEMAKFQVQQMAEYVKFTEGQEAKVTELFVKYGKLMQEMRGAPGSFRDMTDAQRQEMRTKMEAQRAEQDKELKALLSEEQYKQYEVYQEEMQKRRMERMQQGGRP